MFFSVVVPVYNVEKYLRECVDSILCQSFADFELILVNDGSKDGSGAICDEYAAGDSRVKVIHKENGGQSTARNKGTDAARGEYVVYLDSDDFIADRDFLRELHDNAEDNVDVIVYRYCKYYEDGRKNDCGISLAGIQTDSKAELLKSLVKRDAFFCSCWSKSVRLSLIKDNGIAFDTALSCEDMDWYYSVVEKAEKFKVIDKPYVNYRQRENSVTSTFKVKSIKDYLYTVSKWNKRFDDLDADEQRVMLSSLAKLYCNLLISYSRHSKELKAYKKDIFSFKRLLNFDLNPRVKKIGGFARIFGLNLTCMMFRLIERTK